jgi:cytochrome c-type biogenesis protein CcmH/NrfG
MLRKDPEAAISLLAGVPRDAEASFLLGSAYLRLAEFTRAEVELRRAIGLDPMMAEAFYYLGLSLEKQGRVKDAVKGYQAAAALDPTIQQATKKLRSLGAAGKSVRLPNMNIVKETELTLPSTEEEFDSYEPRIRQKMLIDKRADIVTQFQIWKEYKVAIALILLLVAVFAAAALSFVFFGSGDALCDEARKKGIDAPWCK